jgi:hypothetical protein
MPVAQISVIIRRIICYLWNRSRHLLENLRLSVIFLASMLSMGYGFRKI